jgi:hypothetical protein
MPLRLRYLSFDLSEGDDGVTTFEAMASSASAVQHEAVMQEVQQVLDWAWRHFPHSHGPAEEGMDWDHDLQVLVEPGGWHAVSLTISGSAQFVQALSAALGAAS